MSLSYSSGRHSRSSIPTWFAILLLISSSAQLSFHAEGRLIIGSRPPRCNDRIRCSSCGDRCEAIQVPVNAQAKRIRGAATAELSSSVSGTEEYGGGGGEFRYDYKPMRWKCKCGNSIFSP